MDARTDKLEIVTFEGSAVLLAVGFGVDGTGATPSYWTADNLHNMRAEFKAGKKKQRILVSGSGDGALIDVARAALSDPVDSAGEFQHGRAIGWITEQHEFKQIGEAFALIEVRNRVGGMIGEPTPNCGNSMNPYTEVIPA